MVRETNEVSLSFLFGKTFWITMQKWGLGCCLVAQPTMTPWTVSRAGSPVHEILQAGILEWVAILFSRDLPDPGIESMSALQEDSLVS